MNPCPLKENCANKGVLCRGCTWNAEDHFYSQESAERMQAIHDAYDIAHVNRHHHAIRQIHDILGKALPTDERGGERE